MVLVASGGVEARSATQQRTRRPRHGMTWPQAPVVPWLRKPSSTPKQSSAFPDGRPRKHVYGCDVDLAQACFGSRRGHRPPELLTAGETWLCGLTLPRLEGGSRAGLEASDSQGADTRQEG